MKVFNTHIEAARYTSDTPCKRGHLAERYVSTRGCVECSKINRETWRSKNPRKVKEYRRKYGTASNYKWIKNNPDKVREMRKKVRSKIKEKTKARNAVNNAIRDGRMIRPECCSVCNQLAKVQAHHSNYSDPLNVKWVCRKCHLEEHGDFYWSYKIMDEKIKKAKI